MLRYPYDAGVIGIYGSFDGSAYHVENRIKQLVRQQNQNGVPRDRPDPLPCLKAVNEAFFYMLHFVHLSTSLFNHPTVR